DLGVQVHGDVAGKKVAYFVGVFNGVADGGSSDGDVSDYKDVAARVFVTPVEGLGVGVAGTWGKSNGQVVQTDLPQLKTSGLPTFFQYRTGTTLADTAIAAGRRDRRRAVDRVVARVAARAQLRADRRPVVVQERVCEEAVLPGQAP